MEPKLIRAKKSYKVRLKDGPTGTPDSPLVQTGKKLLSDTYDYLTEPEDKGPEQLMNENIKKQAQKKIDLDEYLAMDPEERAANYEKADDEDELSDEESPVPKKKVKPASEKSMTQSVLRFLRMPE